MPQADTFRDFFDNAPIGLYRTEPSGRIVHANAALARILGYPGISALLEVNTADLYVDPADRRNWAERMERDGTVSEIEVRLRRLDGTTIWIHGSSRAVVGGDGRIVYYEGAMYDVSDRKRAEAELERALSLHTATIESTADGLLVVDVDGKIVGFNKRFAELWRIPEAVLASRDDDKALSFVIDQLAAPEAFLKKVRELYDQPEAESYDVLEFKDRRVFERYSRPQQVAGQSVGRVWSFRDVTERRNLEEQLLQSQKLEAVGRLAGGVSHDFNNLLTAILGHSDLLLADAAEHDELREYAEEIRKAALRATSLTRQLLAFSRKQVLQPRVIDLNVIVAEAEQLLRRLIGEDVELVFRLEPRLGHVRADQGQIEQVVFNLAVNARDAMPDGGRLTIGTRNEDASPGRAGLPDEGPTVVLSVSDTGCGIDRETQPLIFEPFFTTKEAGKGTGLGLSTVYGIVRQSEGQILLTSEPDRGTTFDVVLPRTEEALEPRVAEGRKPRAPRGSETLLLVEDDDAVRRLVRDFLRGLGYAVIEASGGPEALVLAEAHPGAIDLLLTDVVMPGMNGRELFDEIERRLPGTRVIYMSGYIDDSVLQGVIDPATPFLQKPFNLDELASQVREIIDR